MKFTKFFLYTHEREDRKEIKLEWIEYVVKNSLYQERQADSRIRRWAMIKEANNKYLRVVLLEDGITVHNAFFDRSFKRKENGN